MTIALDNTSATSQRQVIVEFFAPAANLQLNTDSVQGPTAYRLRADGVLEFAAIPELAPGRRETFLIPYQAVGQGAVTLQARVKSADSPEWNTVQSPLTVNPTADLSPCCPLLVARSSLPATL